MQASAPGHPSSQDGTAWRSDTWAMSSIDLMCGAALDAYERMDHVFWHRDPDTYFAPLSETLIWITAIADAMGKLQEPEYSGIAYARNCVLHGFVIVSDIYIQNPREQSPLKGDHARMVFQGPARIWGFTPDPQPHNPANGKERNRDRRAAYNTHVAEHAVQGLVPRLLLDVGVNIWAVDDSDRGLTPRRQPRRASVPPGYVPNVHGPIDDGVEERIRATHQPRKREP